MKLSQLSTVQAKDVLIQVSALTANITNDAELMDIIGNPTRYKGISEMNSKGYNARLLGIWSAFVKGLLERHWDDVRGILAAVNAKSPEGIEAQGIAETLRQINEIRDDKELIDFFLSFTERGKTAQSAPSATAPEASPQKA